MGGSVGNRGVNYKIVMTAYYRISVNIVDLVYKVGILIHVS